MSNNSSHTSGLIDQVYELIPEGEEEDDGDEEEDREAEAEAEADEAEEEAEVPEEINVQGSLEAPGEVH